MRERRLKRRALVLLLLLAACGGASDREPVERGSASFRAGTFTRPRALAAEPCGLASTERDVWILACDGNLLRLPKRGGDPTLRHLGGEVLSLDGLASGSGRLWGLVSTRTRRRREGAIVAVETGSGAIAEPIAVGPAVPMGAGEVAGRLWVGMLDGRLLAVRDATVEKKATGAPLTWVLTTSSDLWTIDEDGTIALRNPATGAIRDRHERAAIEAIAAGTAFGSLFAATPSAIVRVDPGAEPRPLGVEGTVNAIEPCGDLVWLSQADFGLRALDARGEVVGSVRLAVAPRYLACDGGSSLWVLAEDGRLGSLTIDR